MLIKKNLHLETSLRLFSLTIQLVNQTFWNLSDDSESRGACDKDYC